MKAQWASGCANLVWPGCRRDHATQRPTSQPRRLLKNELGSAARLWR